MTTSFFDDIAREIDVRVAQYKRERAELGKAAARIAELNELIEAAEAEKAEFSTRNRMRMTPEPAPPIKPVPLPKGSLT